MRGVPFGSNIVADTLGADKEDRKFSARPLCIEMSKANGIVGAQCITAGTDVGHAVDLRWIEADPREQVSVMRYVCARMFEQRPQALCLQPQDAFAQPPLQNFYFAMHLHGIVLLQGKQDIGNEAGIQIGHVIKFGI